MRASKPIGFVACLLHGCPIDAGLGSFTDKLAYARMLDREALDVVAMEIVRPRVG